MMLPCSLLVLLNAGGDAARLMTRVLGAIMRAACNTGQRSRCAKVACPGRVEGWPLVWKPLRSSPKAFDRRCRPYRRLFRVAAVAGVRSAKLR
jgi:hypothetical protein